MNGVLSRDIAMVGSQLASFPGPSLGMRLAVSCLHGQHLVVGRTQPVHACVHGVNGECERVEGNPIVRGIECHNLLQCNPNQVDGCYM